MADADPRQNYRRLVKAGQPLASANATRHIRGVDLVSLGCRADRSGRFEERLPTEWFPDRTWGKGRASISHARAGVLRGLHYHYRQIAFWFVVQGRIRVGLFDLRRSSPTRGGSEILELNGQKPFGVHIPAGVGYGFVACSDALLVSLGDSLGDPNGVRGVAWDDPDVGLDWGIANPKISLRDSNNPLLREISAAALPA